MDVIHWKAKMDIQSQTTLPSMMSSTTTSSKISSASYPQSTSNMSTSSMLEPSLSKIIHGPPVLGTGGKKIKIRQPTSKPGIDYTKFDHIETSDSEDSEAEQLFQKWCHGMRDFSLL